MSSTAPRAVKARKVLEWCRYGHQKMMSGDPTGQEWVLIWAGTIALLRAVGHALLKEDDASLKKAQHSWLNALKATEPKPSIFFDFIKHDRDMLLKERFELTAEQFVQLFLMLVGDLRHELLDLGHGRIFSVSRAWNLSRHNRSAGERLAVLAGFTSQPRRYQRPLSFIAATESRRANVPTACS